MSRILKIIKILGKEYKSEFYSSRPFSTLIGTVLSHRTKDETTWPANERLMKVAPTPQKLSKMRVRKIAKIIYPVGFYNQKAKRVKQISKILLKKYKGKVPKSREELTSLPGVGNKTAAIVRAYAFGKPTIAVDTHVNRISKRWGIVDWKSKPDDTQVVLERLIPARKQIPVNHLLVNFGKDICQPLRPRCNSCKVFSLCRYEKKRFYRNYHKKKKK